VSQRSALRVLVVEDDPAVRLSLRLLCQREGLVVVEATDGHQALALLDDASPDLVVLDLMLPGLGGLEVCRAIRRRQGTARLPVIILTARGDEADKVAGLELGADDYVTKPFSPRELMARMRAVLRRSEPPAPPSLPALTIDGLRLDLTARTVTRDEHPIELTRTEFDLLAALAREPGRALSRDQLVARVWGYQAEGVTRLLDSHIGHLRAKLEPRPARPRYVQTVRGVGYRLRISAAPQPGNPQPIVPS